MEDTNQPKTGQRECVTHHFACDCREALFAEAMLTHRRVVELHSLGALEIKERFKEVTLSDMYALREILWWLLNTKGYSKPSPESAYFAKLRAMTDEELRYELSEEAGVQARLELSRAALQATLNTV